MDNGVQERLINNPKDNPYKPPRVTTSDSASRPRPWYYGALFLGIVGSVGAAAAIYFIYVNDPRTGTRNGPSLTTAVVGAAVICGFGWLIAGAIAGTSIRRILIAHSAGGIAAVTWVAIGGTYNDVLSAATVVGWPLGGVAGAGLARTFRNGWSNGQAEVGKMHEMNGNKPG